MKKAVMIAALVVIGTASIFAFGIGAQGGYSFGTSGLGGTALTFKLDNMPWVFAVDVGFPGNGIAVGGTADMWIGTGKISKTPIGYFYGWGVAASVNLGNTPTFGIYGRILGGINIMLLDNFIELYAQIAWQPGVVIPSSHIFVPWNFPIAAGIRFWIK